MIERHLSQLSSQFKRAPIPKAALDEAKKRVLDSLGCFYGAFNAKPGKILRETLTPGVDGSASLWGTGRRVPADLAAWANGTCVRTLDYNDTYLSKEPCHPSDLIAAFWAACEVSGKKRQGRMLLEAMVLGYEVMCRLCVATSIRVRGWDHVTYLPIASAIGCSYILGLNAAQTRNAIALAVVGNNALRQTRVGTISDWKAACAAYAARSGVWAARLAAAGFTGPSDIFSGKNGFFNQVSGPFSVSKRPFGRPWGILSTHTKFFPAEHHAQSAIEAAIEIRQQLMKDVIPAKAGIQALTHFQKHVHGLYSRLRGNDVKIVIETFDVAVDIIGSEKEKWMPTTRETADHSMPYLVVAALLEGDISLAQYERKLFLNPDVRRLMARVSVKHSARYSKMYPQKMPTRLSVRLSDGRNLSAEVIRPKGYAGRPMSWMDVQNKFDRLSAKHLSHAKRRALIRRVASFDRVDKLSSLASLLMVGK